MFKVPALKSIFFVSLRKEVNFRTNNLSETACTKCRNLWLNMLFSRDQCAIFIILGWLFWNYPFPSCQWSWWQFLKFRFLPQCPSLEDHTELQIIFQDICAYYWILHEILFTLFHTDKRCREGAKIYVPNISKHGILFLLHNSY